MVDILHMVCEGLAHTTCGMGGDALAADSEKQLIGGGGSYSSYKS